MFVEIEECVCFLASFLYGKIPRSRIDCFSELLANGLVRILYSTNRAPTVFPMVLNVDGKTDDVVHKAASAAYISVEELLSNFPPNLIVEIRQGAVIAVNACTGTLRPIYPNPENVAGPHSRSPTGRVRYVSDDGRRPLFRIDMMFPAGETDSLAVPIPNFQVERSEQHYPAQMFAATRFGSTKLKTIQGGGDNGYTNHPFTMPSVYAYLRRVEKLLVFLNAIACVSMMQEGSNEMNEQADANDHDDAVYGFLASDLLSDFE